MLFVRRLPRVARSSQPWALGRNPVGILKTMRGNELTGYEALAWEHCGYHRSACLRLFSYSPKTAKNQMLHFKPLIINDVTVVTLYNAQLQLPCTRADRVYRQSCWPFYSNENGEEPQ